MQKNNDRSKIKAWQSAALWIVLTSLGLLVSLFPRKFELWLGPKLGRMLLLLSKRKKVAYENIELCYPHESSEKKQILLKDNYDHYGVLVLELLHLFSPVKGHYRRYSKKIAVLEGYENWKQASDSGKGVLFVSSHLGNWEMMVAMGGVHGIPLTMVTKHLKPEWLHKRIESSRRSVNVKGAYEPRTLPVVLRALRNKESVGFVMDQYAGDPIGIPVLFFGIKVGTLSAVGALAKRTGAQIVPVKTYRDSRGVIHVCIEKQCDLQEIINDEAKSTEFLSLHIEKWVKEYPEQWLWIHRRFKNIA